MSTDCLFCRILAGEIPANRVHEGVLGGNVIAFADINPQAPIHWLFIHNTHTASHSETADPQVYADLLAAAKTAAQAEGLSDYRLVINNGAEAGQSVFHLHLHLLAGRPFTWPPG